MISLIPKKKTHMQSYSFLLYYLLLVSESELTKSLQGYFNKKHGKENNGCECEM